MFRFDWMADFLTVFQKGGIFAYPTEAVYGLGCDPLSEIGMEKILQLKVRPVEKGVIIIASNFDQIKPYITWDEVPLDNQKAIQDTWPGPFTWLIPKSKNTPPWISGDSELIAIRITTHPIVKAMCNEVGSALVSTSANPAGYEPARTADEVKRYFPADLFLIDGALGSQSKPSTIQNSITLERLR